MATLTSTGAVNLTSSTNWSPAQIPVAGDDLVIGAHTLTLDADMTLNTVTLNNASSRLAFTGTARTVQATNGWIVPTAIPATLITTVIGAGISLTLRGKWSFSNTGLGGLLIGDVSGGSLNLATIGDDPSAILIENPISGADAITRVATVSSGSLTTTGRFNVSRGTYGTIVAMTGGLWTHSSSGQNIIGGFQFSSGLTTLSGAASITFTGDVIYTPGGLAAFSIANNWSGSVNFVGSFEIVQSGVPSLVSFGTGCTGSFTFVGSLSLPANNTAATIPSGTFLWQNQTATLPQAKELRFNLTGGVLSLTGLVLNNYGRFAIVRTTGSLLTDSNTQIRNHAPTGQALALNSDQFDGRILQIGIDDPTLPAPEDVAAATEYGYEGFELIGTGLIVDPAVLSAAVLAAQLATLQKNTTFVVERTLEDTKALTFGWHSDAETVQGQVSIDNGAYVPVAGAIAFLRTENGKHYYTLAYNAADRPTVEGTARYRFYSGTDSMYANLRVLKASPRVVDVQAGLALEATSQSVLSGVTALHSNDRSEFF